MKASPESISSKVMSSRFIITTKAKFFRVGERCWVEIGASPIMLFFRFQNPLMWYKEESFPLFSVVAAFTRQKIHNQDWVFLSLTTRGFWHHIFFSQSDSWLIFDLISYVLYDSACIGNTFLYFELQQVHSVFFGLIFHFGFLAGNLVFTACLNKSVLKQKK